MITTEPMNGFFSVFNGHVNRADKRARILMGAESPSYLAELRRIEREEHGIMGIFYRKPTRATKRYMALVTLFVNGGVE